MICITLGTQTVYIHRNGPPPSYAMYACNQNNHTCNTVWFNTSYCGNNVNVHPFCMQVHPFVCKSVPYFVYKSIPLYASASLCMQVHLCKVHPFEYKIMHSSVTFNLTFIQLKAVIDIDLSLINPSRIHNKMKKTSKKFENFIIRLIYTYVEKLTKSLESDGIKNDSMSSRN